HRQREVRDRDLGPVLFPQTTSLDGQLRHALAPGGICTPDVRWCDPISTWMDDAAGVPGDRTCVL
ncbi:MAG TPA: hypothetical protein VF916_02680, partial [Ktedonobacterales bacterium]